MEGKGYNVKCIEVRSYIRAYIPALSASDGIADSLLRCKNKVCFIRCIRVSSARGHNDWLTNVPVELFARP